MDGDRGNTWDTGFKNQSSSECPETDFGFIIFGIGWNFEFYNYPQSYFVVTVVKNPQART